MKPSTGCASDIIWNCGDGPARLDCEEEWLAVEVALGWDVGAGDSVPLSAGQLGVAFSCRQTGACPLSPPSTHFAHSLLLSTPSPVVPMQALRLARPRLPLRPASRAFAAAASSSQTAAPAAAASSAESVVPLSNVEAMWERLSADEQAVVHQQLEELQKRDWKTLTVDEKKAGTCRPCPPVAPKSHFR